jgi:hypothetical protein
MSEEPNVTASSNPVVAKRHGLTKWDRERGQWVKDDSEDAGTELEQPDDAPAVNPFADDGEPDQEPSRYDALTNRELKSELDRRGVEYDRHANKDALIGALEDNDRDAAARAAGE